MVSAGESQLAFIFANEDQLALDILEYLEKDDVNVMATLSKLFNDKVQTLHQTYIQRYNERLANAQPVLSSDSDQDTAKQQPKKKNRGKKNKNKNGLDTTVKTIDGTQVTRLNLFEQKILHKELEDEWTRLSLDELKQMFTQGLRDKFTKEQSNIAFQSANKNKILIASRCLLDNSLNIENLVGEHEETKYEGLYKSDQFTNQTYDFSDPAQLRERQKKLLEAMKGHEAKELALKDNKISVQELTTIQRTTIILCKGGYFALAVYDQTKCILHKSDHKYVVRKKAGQRQLARDSNSGSNIKSMGSQIRRDQERHHQVNIRTILTEAYKEIERSDLILYHAPGVNKYLIMDKGEPLFNLRHKFRSLCLTTKRANYSEVERVAKSIFKIYLVQQTA